MLNKVPNLLRTLQAALKELWALVAVVVVIAFGAGSTWYSINHRLQEMESRIPQHPNHDEYIKILNTQTDKSVEATDTLTAAFIDLKREYREQMTNTFSRLEFLFGSTNTLKPGYLADLANTVASLKKDLEQLEGRIDQLEKKSRRTP